MFLDVVSDDQRILKAIQQVVSLCSFRSDQGRCVIVCSFDPRFVARQVLWRRFCKSRQSEPILIPHRRQYSRCFKVGYLKDSRCKPVSDSLLLRRVLDCSRLESVVNESDHRKPYLDSFGLDSANACGIAAIEFSDKDFARLQETPHGMIASSTSRFHEFRHQCSNGVGQVLTIPDMFLGDEPSVSRAKANYREAVRANFECFDSLLSDFNAIGCDFISCRAKCVAADLMEVKELSEYLFDKSFSFGTLQERVRRLMNIMRELRIVFPQ